MEKRLSHISIWQVALILMTGIALALLIKTVTVTNSESAANARLDRLEQLLQTRYTDELNHAQLMISRQANESGEARISTLKEIQSHIYAADALSMYKVSAFGGAEYMATDTFAQLNSLIEQSINHIRGGSDTSAVLSELSEIINTLQHAFD